MFNNCDFTNKELISVYSYSDKGENRRMVKHHVYNGRKFTEYGEYGVAAYVGHVYKITEKDTGMTVYCVLIGMARQHPNDYKLNMERAWELAAERAEIDPIMAYKTYTKPGQTNVVEMMKNHNHTNIMEMVRTKEEVEERTK